MTDEPRHCEAGTKLTLAGAWTEPCEEEADTALALTRMIGGSNLAATFVYLCETHMDELAAAGLVGGSAPAGTPLGYDPLGHDPTGTPPGA